MHIEAKKGKLGKFPATWFLRGNNQNTLKVQATPDSGLVTAMNNVLGDKICTEGGATKVVEMGGKKITSGLSGTELFIANSGCVFDTKCNVDQDSDCRVTHSFYCIECINCAEDNNIVQKSAYLGTSGRQLHIRQLEHISDVNNSRSSNALFKHNEIAHPGEIVKYKSKPILSGIRFNLDRFILESLKIQQYSQDTNINILNSRAEWGHRGLPRLQINQS